MTFEEKVRAMSAKEIIMAMVNGLKKQHVVVDMITFGRVCDGICYGCAATNTICEISGHAMGSHEIHNTVYRAKFCGGDMWFVSQFEDAIDCLRRGEIYGYNYLVEPIGVATIKDTDYELPRLTNKNWARNMQAYIDFANTLD